MSELPKSTDFDRLIGVAGPIASGKSTFSRLASMYLGLQHLSTSQLVLEEARRTTGLDLPSRVDRGVAHEARARDVGDNAWLTNQLLTTARNLSDRHVIVEGVRVVADAENIIRLGGLMIWMSAPADQRAEQFYAREPLEQPPAFEVADATENEGYNLIDLSGVRGLCQVVFNNSNGSSQERNSLPAMNPLELQAVFARYSPSFVSSP